MAISQPTSVGGNQQQAGCHDCGRATRRLRPNRKKLASFCSPECRREWQRLRFAGNTLRKGLRPTNSFTAGHFTWNKGLKGIHLNPATEFKKGGCGLPRLPVGTVRIRTDKNGKNRAWVKVAEPNTWILRAVKVWTDVHGAIPKGFVVHHKNRNPLDDSPGNLELMSRAEHLEEHRAEIRK